jgi:hypothetical protein
LWLEAYTSEGFVAQGDTLRVNISVNDRAGAGIRLDDVMIDGKDSVFGTKLPPNRNVNFVKTIRIFSTQPITQPYWLLKPMEEGYYTVWDQMLIGEPDVEPAFLVSFGLTIEGEQFYFTRRVNYKYNDQVKGEQNQPLTVVPPATVYASPELLLMKSSEPEKKDVTVQATGNKKVEFRNGLVRLELEKKNLELRDSSGLLQKGQTKNYVFSVAPSEVGPKPVKAVPYVKFDTSSVNFLAMARIRYDHIPNINYFYTDWAKILPIELETYNHRIGYIVGAGDKVPEALEQMGYEVTLLTEKELARNNLKQFDAIISGVRAFNTNEWLEKYYDKLMAYVEQGGNYIVQYSQANNIRAKMGPYPFTLSSKRITDEKAAVTFLKPDHAVLNFPNKITQDDFAGWVQERSIYHPVNLDPKYETILRMNDPGEGPEDGSLVIAQYGKGFFTYTGLVFFRELPAGVPGAYRLIANIIALNRKKDF